jgi:hypothetical protein
MQQQTETTYVVTDDVPTEVKRALIAQDIQMWRNTRFQAESRRRTYARIGNAEQTQVQVKVLEECEAALLDLEEQLRELPKD